MSNRFTAVPDRLPPELGVAQALMPIADGFMRVMLSRPASGTLRTTWVTGGTMLLAGACTSAAAALVALVLARIARWPAPVAALSAAACAVTVVGAGSVLIVGIAQRRSRRD